MGDAYQWGALASQNYQSIGESLQRRGENKNAFFRDMIGMLGKLQEQGWTAEQAKLGREWEVGPEVKSFQEGQKTFEYNLGAGDRGAAAQLEQEKFALQKQIATDEKAYQDAMLAIQRDTSLSNKQAQDKLDSLQRDQDARNAIAAAREAALEDQLRDLGIRLTQTQGVAKEKATSLASQYLYQELPAAHYDLGIFNGTNYDFKSTRDSPALRSAIMNEARAWTSEGRRLNEDELAYIEKVLSGLEQPQQATDGGQAKKELENIAGKKNAQGIWTKVMDAIKVPQGSQWLVTEIVKQFGIAQSMLDVWLDKYFPQLSQRKGWTPTGGFAQSAGGGSALGGEKSGLQGLVTQYPQTRGSKRY